MSGRNTQPSLHHLLYLPTLSSIPILPLTNLPHMSGTALLDLSQALPYLIPTAWAVDAAQRR